MEPESGSIQNGDKLQGAPVQDPPVRTFTAKYPKWLLTPSIAEMGPKVVLRVGNKTLKGEVSCHQWAELDERGEVDTIRLRHPDSSTFDRVSLRDAKALFFVKTFEGDPDHIELQFDATYLPPHKLWVRLIFLDGEVMECLVDSGADLILKNSFFAAPVDPDCNHWLLHVFKSQLRDIQVLALKPVPAVL